MRLAVDCHGHGGHLGGHQAGFLPPPRNLRHSSGWCGPFQARVEPAAWKGWTYEQRPSATRRWWYARYKARCNIARVAAWRLFTYRLPPEPSRHRVAVWRELRKAGAVAVQQATWAVPSGAGFDEALDRACAVIERAEGQALLFDVVPTEPSSAVLEELFTAEREAEWSEFVAECAKFEAEIAGEIAKEKFTLAELDEEEHNLDRLRRWYRELRARDLFGAPSFPLAERRLKECAEVLEDFAERVFSARERS